MAKISLTEEAYRLLKSEIMENRLPPGFQALESELAQRMGMSRTPVREAVIRLKDEGLVEVVPRRGMRVLAVAPEDMVEIYELLTVLEAEAAAMIAKARPKLADVKPLDQAVSRMERAIAEGNREEWGAADDQFHRALLDLCPNRRLASFVGVMLDQAHRARMVTLHMRDMPERSTEEHRNLVAALLEGDAVVVRGQYRAHRERAAEELIGILERYHLHHL